MFKAIGLMIRIAVFSIFVLILGNWIHWGGRTISDQVRLGMAHAERTDLFHSIRAWAYRVAQDARKGFAASPDLLVPEEIAPSERAKLRSLIRELNRSH